MARFLFKPKKYDPYVIDGRLGMFAKCERPIELMTDKLVAKDGYGKVYVDGQLLPKKGIAFKIPQSPMPFLEIPFGLLGTERGKTYTVELKDFVAEDGNKFPDTTFNVTVGDEKKQDINYKAHDDIAKEVASEGMILLKNNGVLPLNENEKLTFCGEYRTYRLAATGAGAINPRWAPNISDAIENNSKFVIDDNAETALYFISRSSGEGTDNRPIKGQYYLTDEEKEEIENVIKTHKKTVLIINSGYPIEMGWITKQAFDAILTVGFGGMLGAYALMEVLDGRVTPSGKLPDTWSYDYYDHPSSKNFINILDAETLFTDDSMVKGAHVFYDENVYVGYRYFDTFEKAVAYPFAYGLSYTDFSHKAENVSYKNGKVTLDVTTENVGKLSGKDVVTVFIGLPKTCDIKKVFVDFDKTKLLNSGEKQTFSFEIDEKRFATYDEKTSSFVLEKGEYKVYVGGSVEDCEDVGTFILEERKTVKKVKSFNRPLEKLDVLEKGGEVKEGKTVMVDSKDRIKVHAKKEVYAPKELPEYHGKKITFEEVKKDRSLLKNFVAQMSVNELCFFNVCGGAQWGLGDGTAGRVSKSKKYGVPELKCSDGNTGVNIKKPNIGFPSSNTVCATFNKDMAYTVGKVIAEESVENGISINLGPALNLHRNILCGRHPEYFSEDPILAGVMAGYHAKGLEENGIRSCYKHLFANGSELERKASHVIATERSLRELYFKAFETAFETFKASTVMTSYNPVNGIYPAENKELLQDLLRDEWGFDGFIMTDWDSYATVDPVECVKAGNCFITPGDKKHVKMLQKAAKEGRLSKAVLQNNVLHIFDTMTR